MKIFDEKELCKISEYLVEKFGKEHEILVEQLIMVEHGLLILFNIDSSPSQQKIAMFDLEAKVKWCEDC